MLPDMNIELRTFNLDDAARVARLVGDRAVSKWTSNIPFPYSKQDAIDWISDTNSNSLTKPNAVELDGHIVGCVSYWPHQPSGFEVGYWVGKDFWGRGVCTEALKRLMASDGFPVHHDTFAKVMAQNLGSQRVLNKCGFSLLEEGAILKNRRKITAKLYVRRAAT